ncbi:MAG: hypothetical protein ABIL25_08600 [candidate division WOR-3 bacterium]
MSSLFNQESDDDKQKFMFKSYRPQVSPRAQLTGWLLACVLATAGAVGVQAEARSFTFGIEPDISSRYLWRGMAQGQGPVCQTSAWVSAADFTFTPWTNIVLGNKVDRWRFNELDLFFDWAGEWHNIKIAPCFGLYLYPNQPEVATTADLTLELSIPVGSLQASSAHTIDLLAAAGAYFGEAGLSVEHELAAGLSLNAQVSVGWASAKFNQAFAGTSRSAMNLAGAEVSFTWSIGNALYLMPHAELNLFTDRELRETQGSITTFAAGLAVGKEF